MAMQAQKKFKSSRHMSTEEKEVFKEIRRQSHISAEQKRRGSIKVWHAYMLIFDSSILSIILLQLLLAFV